VSPEGEAPLPRDEALELIRGLERASRHRRFLLYGLLAILAGFISFSVYLYQDREEEKAQVARLEVQQQQLENTLETARRHAQRLDIDPGARGELLAALNLAIVRAGALDTIFDEAGTTPDESAARPPETVRGPPRAIAGPAAIPVIPAAAETLTPAAQWRDDELPGEDPDDDLLDEDPCDEVFARDPSVVECSWEVD